MSDNPIDDLVRQISEAVGALAEHQQREWRRVSEIAREAERRWNEAFAKPETLGVLGWTVPFEATLSEHLLLVKESTDIETADAAFTKYYTANNSARLTRLRKELLCSIELEYWRPLLEEVFFNLENCKFRTCVAALLPMIEGVTARIFGKPELDKTSKRKKFFEDQIKALKPQSIEHHVWSSYKAFEEGLFAYSSFGDEPNKPLRLNRHWILHGRDIPAGNLSDCLRLLQALDTIVSSVTNKVTPKTIG